jgi:uncharacterized 2Fe-2S/4Fe-4S cluster protein (DUF4445 family)
MAYSIKILNLDKTIRAKRGELLADKIVESGIDLSLYCQKKGVCGKCYVEIVEGYLPPLDEKEGHSLKKKRLNQNYRLACRYRINGDVVIHIPPKSLIQKTLILKTGIRRPLSIDPLVKKYFLQINEPGLAHPHSLLSEWRKQLRKKTLKLPLNVLQALPEILKKGGQKITTVMHGKDEILAVEPGDTTDRSYGLAVDLGTTTLVVELVDLNTGESVDAATGNNGQMKYGMDIVSRISYAFESPDNRIKLQAAVIKTLSQMIEQLLENNQVSRDNVYEMVFAGNTAMNHLLLGASVNTLALAPFNAVFHKLPPFMAKEIGIRLHPNAKAYIVPNIKSFVGGDISAGLQATDLANLEGALLFVDLGTNGEIVLKTEKKFVATSTAAGPAFEGMNIGSGMLALPGAIYKAEKKNRLILHTIGKEKPQGICGTGLIDLMALFLEEGKISSNGKITGKLNKIEITGDIAITQKDVREIQLAVSAVKTGVRMICEKHRIKIVDLDRVYIAGAFGNYLNTKNAMRIGLLPGIDPDKIVFVGNSSLAGARALLLSQHAREKTESLIRKVHYISLATDMRFQQYFIDSLNFGGEVTAE